MRTITAVLFDLQESRDTPRTEMRVPGPPADRVIHGGEYWAYWYAMASGRFAYILERERNRP